MYLKVLYRDEDLSKFLLLFMLKINVQWNVLRLCICIFIAPCLKCFTSYECSVTSKNFFMLYFFDIISLQYSVLQNSLFISNHATLNVC